MNKSSELPSKTEYEISLGEIPSFTTMEEWSEPKYKCPKCNGGMRRNEQMVCASNPPKYIYQCNKCGNINYLHR